MNEKPRQPGAGTLPDFLKVSVEKGILDERSAQRIELHRRSRGLGKYRSVSSLMSAPADPTLTFDSYLVCKGNSFAVELARAVASNSATNLPYNPLYFYGDVGLGKTHLLSAIANAAGEKEVLLANTADLEAELERAERLKCRAELREWLVAVDLLLVDDIQLCEGQERVQRDLFSVLNHRTKAHRWVVITSDVPPTRLAGVERRLISRFDGGVIVSLQMGDGTERQELIRHFLDDRTMPEDVLHYLADNITDNVRRLKAAVSRLVTTHASREKPLTIDMAREIVKPPEPISISAAPTDSVHSGPGQAEKESVDSTKALREIPDEDQPVPEEPETIHEEPETPDSPTALQEDTRTSRLEVALADVESEERDASVMRLLKKMLAGAESREEQCLALQIAVGERIRQLRAEQGDREDIEQLEIALELLREGRMEEAIQCISI